MQLRACAHANSKRNKGFVFGAILGFFKTENDFEQVLHQDRHAENSVGPPGPQQESKIGSNILLHVSVTIQE